MMMIAAVCDGRPLAGCDALLTVVLLLRIQNGYRNGYQNEQI